MSPEADSWASPRPPHPFGTFSEKRNSITRISAATIGGSSPPTAAVSCNSKRCDVTIPCISGWDLRPSFW